MGTIEVLVPTAAPAVAEQGLAPRPASLEGLRIGLYDNMKANAAPLLRAVVDGVASQAERVDEQWEHKSASAPAPQAVMDRLEKCDAVILAMAD